jgi:hypothetical protein
MEGQEKTQVKDRGFDRKRTDEGNRMLPKVTMDDKLFQELCSSWKEALVVKLLGKNMRFNLMKDRLKKLWRLNY